MERKYFEEPQLLCLENLVGISQKECECFVMPTDQVKLDLVKKSKTGLYIDEHEGAINCLFLTKAPCGEGDVFDRLIKARRESILKLIIDVAVEMNVKYKPRVNYERILGEFSYANLLPLPAGKQGYKFTTRKNLGGKMIFKGMGFLAKLPDNVNEQIVTIQVDKLDASGVVIESVATFNYRIDMKTKFWGGREADIEIYDIEPFELLTDGSTYEISYQYNPNLFTPYNNQIVCNCEGVKSQLKKFYKAVPTGNAYGMTFNVDYRCDDQFLLCALANSNQTLEYITGEAIRNATLYKFLVNEKARATAGATSTNVLKITSYDEMIGMFSSAYSQSLSDLTKNYNTFTQELDCFTCNPNQNIGRTQGIFVS